MVENSEKFLKAGIFLANISYDKILKTPQQPCLLYVSPTTASPPLPNQNL